MAQVTAGDGMQKTVVCLLQLSLFSEIFNATGGWSQAIGSIACRNAHECIRFGALVCGTGKRAGEKKRRKGAKTVPIQSDQMVVIKKLQHANPMRPPTSHFHIPTQPPLSCVGRAFQ